MVLRDTTFDRLDWEQIGSRLDADGYAVLPGLLANDMGRDLARQATATEAGSVSLEAGNWGRGELAYFGAAMPAALRAWRTALYSCLAGIADQWNETLGGTYRYPAEFDDFLLHHRRLGQTHEQSFLCRLGVDDYMSLHQRNDGAHAFPLQVVALLSEPGVDFLGGQFVMTEQRPRMQSRPAVLPLGLGDVAIITTAGRPFKGAKGFYRVNHKHAISRVRKGLRIGMELSFHQALSLPEAP